MTEMRAGCVASGQLESGAISQAVAPSLYLQPDCAASFLEAS